jgi:hypothetical protein
MSIGAVVLGLGVCSEAQAQWTVTSLHPAGAGYSYAWDARNTQQVGQSVLFGSNARATLWSGTPGSAVNLHPSFALVNGMSNAIATNGTRQVGWADRRINQQNMQRPILWSGTAASAVDLSPAGATGGFAWALTEDGTKQVGATYVGPIQRASLWSGTAASWVDLNPTGSTQSWAFGITDDGTQQAGMATLDGVVSAALWSGTAASFVNLNPAGSTSSVLVTTNGTQQVGQATIGGVARAGLWSGTAASFVDLHPAAFAESSTRDLLGTLQVGWVMSDDFVYKASLWNGTAGSWFDLSSVLTGSWGDTEASSIWSDGSTIYIAGYGFNNDTGLGEALIWSTPVPAPGTAALLGLGGLLAARRRR